MSAVAISPKPLILNLIQQGTFSKEAFSGFEASFKAKLIERTLPPRTPELKEELDRIYGLYKAAVQSSLECLQANYDLGQKVIEAIKETEDLGKIYELFIQYQADIAPFLAKQQTLSAEVLSYERQLIPLLPLNTTFTRKK